MDKTPYKPTLSDVKRIERLLGIFPSLLIEQALLEKQINIHSDDIPKSFAKYFALLSAYSCGKLEGKSLVDFGCGLGVFVSQASKLGMKSEGIDNFHEYDGRCYDAAEIISNCISENALPVLTVLDFLNMELNRQVDFVSSFGMLEHIYGQSSRDLIIKKMMNALKSGGYLILTCGPNKRFPIDLYHYGPTFLFYHCLPVKLREWYLRLFGKGLNQNPKWLNGMDINEISGSILSYGGGKIKQLYPLWVEISNSRVLNISLFRLLALTSVKILAKIKAEPVIILIAQKIG